MRRVLAVVLLAIACGPEPTDPALSPLIVMGDGQQGAAGARLPLPLMVQAIDSRGRPAKRLDVRWLATSGGGHPEVDVTRTDQNGNAVNYWTLGTTAGQPQRMEARVIATNEMLGGFSATAVAGPAAQMTASAGDGQTAEHGTNVAIRPAVRVTDQYGNPTSGITVTFAVTSGGGSVSGASPTPDANGIAAVGSWTLGPTPGSNTLAATASGLSGSPVTFTATGTVGAVSAGQSTVSANPSSIEASAGAVPSTITVTARDAGGFPISGATVTLAATGTGNALVQPAVTDESGVAAGTLSSTAVGTKTVSATVNGVVITQTAAVTVTSAAAATMSVNAGDNQSAGSGQAVAIPPSVLVQDAFGNPVSDVAVTFAVTSGGGIVTDPNPATTSGSGIGTIGGWTLGPSTGTNTLTAAVEGAGIDGNPLTFTATGLGDYWTSAAPLPAARDYLASGTVNGILYVMGGGGSKFAWGRMDAYDPTTNAWTPKAPMPIRRTATSVGVVNGVLYTVGGWDSIGVSGAVEAYDPVTNTWTTKAPLPTPRYFLAVDVIDGVLYASGGWAGPLVCDPSCGWHLQAVATVEAYDPLTDSWTTKSPMPTPRVSHRAAAVNGILYVVGGKNPDVSPALATVDAYDPATDTWVSRAPMPTARWGMGVADIHGILYAAGGEVPPNTIIATLEAYDPATDTWSTKTPLPRIREEFGTAVLQGFLYAVGGRSYFDTPSFWGIRAVDWVEVYHP